MSSQAKAPPTAVRRKGEGSATQRLKQDYMRLVKDPIPYITAHPLPSNILEWYYAIRGPEGTPYENGVYHGKLAFPIQFPFSPPKIWVLTPNGRFKTNTKLCLSITDFHPEKWNPIFSVSTILTGLLSFMVEETPTFGSCISTVSEKKALAKASWRFNLKNEIFCELFPELAEELRARIEKSAANESKACLGKESKSKADQTHSNQDYNLVDFLKSCALNVVTGIGLVILLMFLSYILAA